MTAESYFFAVTAHHYPIEDVTIAVREFGRGPHLVFIHGYPTHGYTWRKLLPTLAQSYHCHVIDLPGLGDSQWSDDTDLRFTAQAGRLCRLLESLGLAQYSIIAHDTGGTLARLVAMHHADRVKKLILINTEMPGHRPPWIPLYQTLAALPGAGMTFTLPMRLRWFLRSSMGFGEFYCDTALFDDPANLGPYVNPLLQSSRRVAGALGYLRGIEWEVVDRLRDQHATIQAETLLIWGEEDHTFPIKIAEDIRPQFHPPATLLRIPKAKLMPHEERPDLVLEAMAAF